MGPQLSIGILDPKNSVHYSTNLSILRLYKEDYGRDRHFKLSFRRGALLS